METSCMFNVIMAEKKCKNYCIKVIYGVLHMKEILKWLSLAWNYATVSIRWNEDFFYL